METRRASIRFVAASLAASISVLGCGATAPSPSSDAAGQGSAVEQRGAPGALWGPWQPTPFDVAPALHLQVDRVCRASMQPFPAVPLVAVDARGEGLVQALFAGPQGQAVCMDMVLHPGGTVDAMGGGSTSVGPQPSDPPPLNLRSDGGMSSGGGPGEVARSLTSGKVGPGITRVVVQVPGKGAVTASLENGWYIASYPGAWPAGTVVVGLDVLGNVVAQAAP